MEDSEPYFAEGKKTNEPNKPMHDAFMQLNIIFSEILKCALTPFSINYETFLSYNQQLEAMENKIRDLKIYLERKTR